MTYIVRLPWPPKGLHPNHRPNRYEKARRAKSYRKAAYFCAKEARLPIVGGDAPVTIHITYHPPCSRARDKDNLRAALKSGLDGISDALRVDDKNFSFGLETIGSPIPHGDVVLAIEIGGAS